MSAKPLFSILHTSARPDKWRAVYDDWMSKAVHPERVEYVLCVDPRWGFSTDPIDYPPCVVNDANLDNLVVIQNTGRRCYVDGVNLAARASSGSILIVNADDQFGCDGWDREILSAAWGKGSPMMPATGAKGAVKYHHTSPEERAQEMEKAPAFVIEVDCGGSEHQRGIMPMPILSHARYEQQGGNVFWPEYESMFADNDFCAWARKDGVVIEALHLLFPHRHPMNEPDWENIDVDPRWDAAYQEQNRREAYELGLKIFAGRKGRGFAAGKRCIAMCYPGDDFRGAMHDALLNLYAHLIGLDWEVFRMRAYTPNVYTVREGIRRTLTNLEKKPDVVLWMDHDNPLTPAQFEQLLAGLDAHPEVDGLAGWCWIYNEQTAGFTVSCGEWAPDHLHWNPFPPSFVKEQKLKPFECGGFPCFLMRYGALTKAGEGCFLPIVDNRLENGLLGEDFAFFLNAEKGGARFMVDPRVQVPHLKYVGVQPMTVEEGAPTPVKVACMIRARNEGRWIGRVIEAVKPLCGNLIYLMEDGSTDDTVEIAKAAGAEVINSPFAGQELDERRDKNWLLSFVRMDCSPDWIFMPDGDEELEPGGCEKIRAVLESNPPFDCFALRILNLWNALDTFRVDGVYGNMHRQSLFRADLESPFVSFYEGTGKNHVGFHTSNAPGLGGARVSPLNVNLLHYGPLYQEDRIRKFEWISKMDPNNEGEGGYLHMVQGDIPAVPFDAKLKHAGPLKTATLPPRLVPKFDVMPGPLCLHEQQDSETAVGSAANV